MSNYKNLIESIKEETTSTRSKISDTYLELVELFPLLLISVILGLFRLPPVFGKLPSRF